MLIEVKASGINPVDTYFRKGIRQVPSFPHIPHFDLAGVVKEVGEHVTSLQSFYRDKKFVNLLYKFDSSIYSTSFNK